MAGFVGTALARNRHLLAEAGVGTGKTYAYVIPLLQHLRRDPRPVIVATHSIALQNQLMQDIPRAASLVGIAAPALLAKGREHYACRAAIEALGAQADLAPAAAALVAWGKRTATGDRAGAPAVDERLWRRVAWGAQAPCGARCKHPERCGAGLVRRRWQELETGFVVTNHHQFFADMALRARGAHLFPQAGAIVLDEAHAVPDAARDMLGARARPDGLAPALREAARLARAPGAEALVARAKGWPALVAAAVDWGAAEEAERFAVAPTPALAAEARVLADAGGRLLGTLGGLPDRGDRAAAIDALGEVLGPLRGLLDPGGQVVWAEGDRAGRRVHLLATAPRDLAPVLAARLFQRQVPVIMTSATLAPGGDFGYFQAAVGLPEGIGPPGGGLTSPASGLASPGKPLRCVADSPFDYEAQARLYVATDMPDPAADAEAFYAAATERLAALVDLAGGRTLALFTARSRARAAFAALDGRTRVPVGLQGADAAEGLAALAGAEERALLGTAYWTGVDVRGLKLVVIVKLPFPPPDPLLAAQEAAARARGEDPFEAVLLPAMLQRLRQGAGRLIRREDDRGVVAILDPRAASRGYAGAIAAALPPMPAVSDLAGIRAFLS